MSPRQSEQQTIGDLGERLVTHWLRQQGWQIVARGWHSRWGELDVVAQAPGMDCLAFVEVKTRSQGNWDADGLLAITAHKQAKLWKTARLFLSQHPQFTELPCRFDVALVRCTQEFPGPPTWPAPIKVGQPIAAAGHVLTLVTYLEAAFSE